MSRVACDALDKPIDEVFLHDLLQMQDPVLLQVVDAIHNEARNTGLGGALYAESLGLQLAVHLLRNYANVTFKASESVGSLTPLQKRRLVEYIHSNIQNSIRMEGLAEIVGMGVWTFSRKFADTFQCTPHTFVTSLRVEKAKQMLTDGNCAIKQIAGDCGFSDQAHLTRVLRAKLGVTPGQLRRA
ncbi:helix-turn-helix domain-containing protein [Pontibacter sp. JAM-7]|uniref:helix-turn-helix domain-containing protein n=1 Tax=Pontibacter sp. JAM-7 TaxID=3366581 RepID=UPI003AF453E5